MYTITQSGLHPYTTMNGIITMQASIGMIDGILVQVNQHSYHYPGLDCHGQCHLIRRMTGVAACWLFKTPSRL